jgi:cytochrome b
MSSPNEISPVKTIRVWDLFVRLFHWTLVLGFATAFVSGEFHYPQVHALAGYTLCLLLVARIYWGFKGSEYARFRSFLFSINETLAYVKSLSSKHPKHYFGHNPAGSLMVFALLAMVLLLVVTGLVILAAIDFEGPLIFLANALSDETSYAFLDLHKLLPFIALGMVVLHLGGVVSGTIQHKENLVRAMITGNKPIPNKESEGHQ